MIYLGECIISIIKKIDSFNMQEWTIILYVNINITIFKDLFHNLLWGTNWKKMHNYKLFSPTKKVIIRREKRNVMAITCKFWMKHELFIDEQITDIITEAYRFVEYNTFLLVIQKH